MPFQCFRDSRVAKEVCAIDKEIFSIFPFRDVTSDVSSPFWFEGLRERIYCIEYLYNFLHRLKSFYGKKHE